MLDKKPFRDVNIGQVFLDIKGIVFIKTEKTYARVKEGNTDKEMNCVVLIPNHTEDFRGMMRSKEDDTYCEVLDNEELSELPLVEESDIK